MEEFICECGKAFKTKLSLSCHRAQCEVVIGPERKAKQLEKCNKPATVASAEACHEKSRQLHQQQLLEWLSAEHRCEKCGKILIEKYGSGRFCSQECARSFASNKVNRLEQKLVICEQCGSEFLTAKNSGKKICDSCLHKKRCKLCGKLLDHSNKSGYCAKCLPKTEDGKEYLKQVAKKVVETRKINGTQVPWKSRNIASYSENFWVDVLDSNCIKYTREFTANINPKKWYFLDFYIEVGNIKLDLEIDGKQHLYEERLAHDKERDKLLIDAGYTIYRIPWNEINSEEGKLKMKEKIDNFLSFYNSNK